jgi:prophage antirepressor-like protein
LESPTKIKIRLGEVEMNVLTNVFQYQATNLRTFLKDGEPWFVAKDVCEVLEIKNSRDALSRLDEDEKDVALTDTPSGQQSMNVVNEYGLYNLILTSRKPEAKQFKRWITHEVIPSIRKTGQYVKPLTEREQLIASMKLTLETAEEITHVKSEVKEIRGMVENQITLDHGEQRRIQKAVGAKVYEIEPDPTLRKEFFSELHREIKDRFGVTSYKDIKRKDMQAAIRYIEAWIPRVVNQK